MGKLVLSALAICGLAMAQYTPPSGGGGGGGVSSVGLNGTTNQIAISGATSPITGSGTYTAGFTSTIVIPNGSTATTQSASDNSTKVATTAYADRVGGISGLTTNKLSKAASSTTITDSSVSDDGTTVSTAEKMSAASYQAGASPPSVTGGAGIFFTEATAPSGGIPASGVDGCYADSSAHTIKCSFNNDTASALARAVNNLSFFGATTSAQLAGVLSDETGSGSAVFATSATLVTPVLGTPASGDATNLTNIPVNQAKSGAVLPAANLPNVNVLISTSGAVSDPGNASDYQYNNASGALTFNAPAGVAGLQRCYRNATGKSGAITIQMATSNTVDKDGANGSSAGTLVSGGALGDAVCLVSDSSNHWYAYVQKGTWTNN